MIDGKKTLVETETARKAKEIEDVVSIEKIEIQGSQIKERDSKTMIDVVQLV